jgi:hypothetical protein
VKTDRQQEIPREMVDNLALRELGKNDDGREKDNDDDDDNIEKNFKDGDVKLFN